MYGGQGNYTPQFRQPSAPPPPPPPSYQQASPGPALTFLQAPPGPILPPVPQAPPYFGRLMPSQAQPIHFPHPSPVNSTQPYLQLPPPPPAPPQPPPPPPPPPPPTQLNGSAPAIPPYPLAGLPVPMPLPPPPPRMLQPILPPNSQSHGQVFYHSLHPPRPGIIHAPPQPPWPTNAPNPPPSHSNLELPIPTPFTRNNPTIDVYPPAIPPLPPPPPPPPPSSPPPLPPSPPAPTSPLEVFPSDSLEVLATDFKADSNAPVHLVDNAPVHLIDASKDFKEGNTFPLVDGETSENLASPPLPPPRPDEAIVQSIEVLCQFIVKVGPDFENTARANEAGNPQFAFLFGGEPGSAAAIGHEYFQWMKKQCVAVMDSPKALEHKILPSSTLTADVSLQPGNLERPDVAHSPAISDMDMEDDITPADIGKGFGNTNEVSIISSRAGSYASENENVEDQIHAKTSVASGASSPTVSLMDAEDEKESLVFEDVSPERGSPDTTGLGDNTHASSKSPTGDSMKGEVLLDTEDVKSQEASGVFLKYGSPFRLIQDYASDESDETVKSGNDENFNPVSPSPITTTVISSLQQEKQSELCPNFGGQDFTAVANESGYDTVLCQLSPSIPQGTGRSPDKSSPLISSQFDTMSKTMDSDIHSIENLSNDGRETSRPSSEYDALEGRKMVADIKTVELRSMEKQASHDVDEFGRLIRKGLSGSDSDDSQYNEQHGRKRRSRSRSMSRSPQGSRKRLRSRSPRRRDKRSHSHSWSPKRGRSKSPPSFKTNMSARRGRDLPHECLNFNRGRCFYGASCRFLHRDFGHQPNMQRRYQDQRKPRYLDSYDDASLSRISRHDNTGTTELHAEKSLKLVEARDYEKHVYKEQYDTRTGTVFQKFSDGKDELVPALETEDATNQVSQEMISPELESPVEKVPVEHILISVGESTQSQLESSEPQQADSFSVQSPAGNGQALFEQPSSGDVVSFQPSQSITHANASEAEMSSQHAHVQASSVPHHLPVQTSHPANDSFKALTCQINVGENMAVEATANQNIATTYSNNVTSIKPPVQPFHDEFSPHLLTSGANFQTLQPLPHPPHGQRPMHIPNDSLNGSFSSQHFRENVIPPMTNFQSQLPPSQMFYPPRPPLPGNLISNNTLQPNYAWSDLTPPPPQNMFSLLSRPPFPSEPFQLHHQHNAMLPRNDFMPSVGSYPSGEVPGSRPSGFYPQSFHSVSSGHLPRHQPFPNVQNQGFTPSSSLPLVRSFQGEEISMPRIRDVQYSHQPSLYNQENPAASNLPPSFGTAGSMHPSIQRYPENYFRPQPSDVGLPIFPIREHFNPYASTFEHPLRGPGIPGPEMRRFDSAPSADNVPIVGMGFGTRASPSSSRRLGEQVLPNIASYAHESFTEVIPDSKKQLVQEPVAGAQYDPLFDSIDPSSDTSKMRVEEQNSGINDTGSASKLNPRKPAKVGSKKHRGGSLTELKVEVDELGEVATDADAGGVENESPQLLDKDWSPGIPFDDGETNVGEIEISQARSPGKSKKNRDSRSMRLFKIALADFAKEVLKPSWRQGNLSKEAFKTIVKKTVDKVAGAVPSHHIPKSQSKINQYVESSQRKLTKLVMGYVDKYVKM